MLGADGPSFAEEQHAEADCRLALRERNPSDVIPWEHVRAGLLRKP